MLRTIPKRIMTNKAVLKVPESVNRYGEAGYKEYDLVKVHIQPTHSIRKSAQDKEVFLNAVLFYDPRVSEPLVDWQNLQSGADNDNAQMKVVSGGMCYTVFSIDLVPDDEGKLHHVEVGLI